jgi:hypothetical protein
MIEPPNDEKVEKWIPSFFPLHINRGRNDGGASD